MERRPRVRIPLEYLEYRRRRNMNYGTAAWTLVACAFFSAFIVVVARCVP